MFGKYSRSGLALMGVPLYAGPVLAGWSAAPLWVFVLLVALFFAMQMLRNISYRQAALPPVAQVFVLLAAQVVAVGAAWGVGVLGALALGALAAPAWLPLTLSSVGAVVGALRYRRTPEDDEMDAVMDDALRALETGVPPDWDDEGDDPPPGAADDPAIRAAVQEALETLWALPEDVRVHDIDPIVQRLEDRADHHGFAGLLAELNEGFRAVDLAMLRYLASPRVRRAIMQAEELDFALSLLLESEDEAVLGELAALTMTLIEEGAAPDDLPPLTALKDKAADFPILEDLIAPLEAAYRGRDRG